MALGIAVLLGEAANGQANAPIRAEDVGRLIEELSSNPPRLPAERVRFAQRFVACGAVAIAPLYALWTGETPIAPPADEKIDARREKHREECIRAVAEAGLDRLQLQGLYPFLLARLEGKAARPDACWPALRLFAAIGRAHAVAPFCAFVTRIDDAVFCSHVTRQMIRRAIAEILERDAGAFGRLAAAMRGMPADRLDVLLRGVSEVDSPRAAGFLVGFLGRYASLDADLVLHLSAEEENLEAPVREALTAFVSSGLAASDVAVRRSCVVAAERLREPRLVDGLILGLESDDGAFRSQAHTALRSLTGRTLPLQPESWRAWWAAEQEWWNEVGRVRLNTMDVRNATEVFRVLQDVGRHPVYVRSISNAVLPLFDSSDARIREVACATLAALRASGVRAAMSRLREDPDPRVRVAVRRYLRTNSQPGR